MQPLTDICHPVSLSLTTTCQPAALPISIATLSQVLSVLGRWDAG